MENASKALVIAGAILATLMVVGLGIGIIGSVSGIFENTGVSEQEVQQNNSKFESYFGNNLASAKVKELLALLKTHNYNALANDEELKTIKIYYASGEEGKKDSTPETFKISSGARYNVSVYNDNRSSVEAITETSGTQTVDTTTTDGYYINGFIRCIKIEKRT